MRLKTYITAVLAVLLITACSLSGSNVKEPQSKSDTKEAAPKKKGPKMMHQAALPGELCVGCHMETAEPDPESITPKINNMHPVCNRCHKEDGSTASGHCGCEDVSDPMDCETCHTTPPMGDNPSAEDMNDLCLACH